MQQTTDQLREDYLRWLEPQIRDEHGNPSQTYWYLLNLMFETEFRIVMSMDENRVVDGLDLRVEFARKHNLRSNTMTALGPCSFLEVLIGLSHRLAFYAGGSAPGWAWQLLCNLELSRMTDPLTRHKHRKATQIMEGVICRAYAPDGTGGFFPLAWPDEDQTGVELWYQMHAYIEELHPEH